MPEIEYRTKDLNSRRVARQMSRSFSTIGSAAADTTRNIGRIAGTVAGIGGAIAGIGISAFAADVSRTAQDIQRWNQITGLSVETLDALGRAAGRYGADLDVITEAQIAAVDKAQAAILQGGDALNDFQREFNLSARDFVQLGPAEQLEAMADAVFGIGDPTRRAATASALFGDEAVKLLPVLEDVAEKGLAQIRADAESVGKLLDEQSANTLVDNQRAWQDVRLGLSSVATEMLVGLAPAITQVANFITERLVPALRNAAVPAFTDFSETISQFIEDFLRGFDSVDASIPAIELPFPDVMLQEDTSTATQIGAQVREALEVAWAAVGGDTDAQQQVSDAIFNVITIGVELVVERVANPNVWSEIAQAAFRGLRTAWASVWSDLESATGLGDVVVTLISAAIGIYAVAKIAAAIVPGASAIGSIVLSGLRIALAAIPFAALGTSIATGLGGALASVAALAAAPIASMAETIALALLTGMDGIRSRAVGAAAALRTALSTALGAAFGAVSARVIAPITTMADAIATSLLVGVNNIRARAVGAMAALRTALVAAMTSAVAFGAAIVGPIASAASTVVTALSAAFIRMTSVATSRALILRSAIVGGVARAVAFSALAIPAIAAAGTAISAAIAKSLVAVTTVSIPAIAALGTALSVAVKAAIALGLGGGILLGLAAVVQGTEKTAELFAGIASTLAQNALNARDKFELIGGALATFILNGLTKGLEAAIQTLLPFASLVERLGGPNIGSSIRGLLDNLLNSSDEDVDARLQALTRPRTVEDIIALGQPGRGDELFNSAGRYLGAGAGGISAPGPVNVNVNVQGSVLSERDLTDQIERRVADALHRSNPTNHPQFPAVPVGG